MQFITCDNEDTESFGAGNTAVKRGCPAAFRVTSAVINSTSLGAVEASFNNLREAWRFVSVVEDPGMVIAHKTHWLKRPKIARPSSTRWIPFRLSRSSSWSPFAIDAVFNMFFEPSCVLTEHALVTAICNEFRSNVDEHKLLKGRVSINQSCYIDRLLRGYPLDPVSVGVCLYYPPGRSGILSFDSLGRPLVFQPVSCPMAVF